MLLALALFLAPWLTTLTFAVVDVMPGPELIPVATGVWRVPAARGESEVSNAGATIQLVVVRDGARTWLVGSGPTPTFGTALARLVVKTTGHAVTDLVNTRAAPELAMGNIAFEGARLWALPDVIETMILRCPQCQERLKAHLGEGGVSLRPDSIRVPFTPIGKPSDVEGAIGPFAWVAFERAPGERTLVLTLRSARLVIAQGLLWAGDLPDLRDTRIDFMRSSLERLHDMSNGMRLLGEQGDVACALELSRHLSYLDRLESEVAERLDRGDVQGTPEAAIELPEFAALPGYATRHPLNVQRAWHQLEPGIFR